MTPDNDDEKYRIPLGDLAPIVTAGAFAVVFLIVFLFLTFGSLSSLLPWLRPGAQPAAPSGEVTVTIPEKRKN